jgi:hypothetical protein
MLRARGYLTLPVRIGYEFVLIVSGSLGEAAIIDLSNEPSSLWNDAWLGMRQVLPRVPVVAVVPKEGIEPFDLGEHVPVTRVTEPVDADQIVQAIEQLLQPTTS